MNLQIDLNASYKLGWPFNHTVTKEIKVTEPVPEGATSVKLPLGLQLDASETGGKVAVELDEAGMITLWEDTLTVTGSKQVNLNPLPGLHIVGTIALVA